MKTKNDIIDELFRSEKFDLLVTKMIRKIDRHLLTDFKQDLFLILLEKPDDLIIDLYNKSKLEFFCIRIIMNQINSKSSPFYRTYKKEVMEYIRQDFDETTDDIETKIYNDYINDISNLDNDRIPKNFDILKFCKSHNILSWYEYQIFTLYYKMDQFKDIEGKMTMRRIENEWGIDHVSIFETLKSIKNKIRKQLNKNNI